ncbi:M48 family metalloprotease [Streptomyces sp. O3]
MSGIRLGSEAGARAARSRALAVLRVRGRALALALLPAAVAVVLAVAVGTGRIDGGGGLELALWLLTGGALLVLLAAAGVALVIARARPALSPTVPIAEESAPDLYRLVRDLADRLEVPAPSAIALTPDCDSWLEDRAHPAQGRTRRGESAPHAARDAGDPSSPAAPVLVIGSPFMWWMRVAELRAVLAPVVAGTGPSAHPDIAAARRFIRGLDAAVAVASRPGRAPLTRAALSGVGWISRLLLRACRGHAAEMERGVAAAAAERAKAVDYGPRIVAQEQVGLAYAGWDRLLTRVALPAWRMGRWPSRLDAGVVSALTELSRRDRLADGFASRLGERPACDLLEEPGSVDEAASLLAARLFHGGPAEQTPDWSPVGWQEYPEEVVDRKWRMDAARLHRVLDALDVRSASADPSPDLSPDPSSDLSPDPSPDSSAPFAPFVPFASSDGTSRPDAEAIAAPSAGATGEPVAERMAELIADPEVPTLNRVMDHLTAVPALTSEPTPGPPPGPIPGTPSESGSPVTPDVTSEPAAQHTADAADATAATPTRTVTDTESDASEVLAARLTAEVAREEAAAPSPPPGLGPDDGPWGDGLHDGGQLPLFPLQPPRTGRELLADHVTAMVCCAAIDTAGAAPGLDWLDGPALLVAGERATDLAPRIMSLVENGDPDPLRDWLAQRGVRPEKPVRLV